MSYGFPLLGSKNKIANDIIDLLPAGGVFYDLFCGGCAITHCAALSKKWERVIANDIDPFMPLFFEDAVRGTYENVNNWCSREDFFRFKNIDPFVRFVYSFGYDGRSYLYSEQVEKAMKLAHEMIFAESPKDRRLIFRRFMLEAENLKTSTTCQLPHLYAIERVNSLANSLDLSRINMFSYDYSEVPLTDDGVIYCDIPYQGTHKYTIKEFDYERFYAWCEAQKLPVFISSYEMPKDRFDCIAEIDKNTFINNKQFKRTVEKIFIPKHQSSSITEEFFLR